MLEQLLLWLVVNMLRLVVQQLLCFQQLLLWLVVNMLRLVVQQLLCFQQQAAGPPALMNPPAELMRQCQELRLSIILLVLLQGKLEVLAGCTSGQSKTL